MRNDLKKGYQRVFNIVNLRDGIKDRGDPTNDVMIEWPSTLRCPTSKRKERECK